MKNGLFILLISLSILFFFGSCEMNSKAQRAVAGQNPDEVHNIKTWNKQVGGNATLLSSRIEKKGDVLSIKFTFTIDSAGSYYITALADGLEGEEYTASIDGSPIRTGKSGNTVSTKILLGENGWQSATVGTGDTGKAFPVLLEKGEHSIAFQGANIPNIVDINVDPVLDKTLFPLDDYKIEMDMLIERSKRPDIQRLIQQKANPEMQKALTKKDDPLYGYNHYYVSGSAGTYVYRKYIYLYSGTTYTFETKQTPGSGAVDTVLYLYKSGTTGSNSYVNDDGGTGFYSKITKTISSPGAYYVMVRAYSSTSYGVADIYKNGSPWSSSAAVGGYKIYVDSTSDEYSNYFTANRSTNVYTNDSYIWVTSG